MQEPSLTKIRNILEERKEEEYETNKLKTKNGKYYNTDVVDIEGRFRIIESIPSKNVEPIKWLLAGLDKGRKEMIIYESR